MSRSHLYGTAVVYCSRHFQIFRKRMMRMFQYFLDTVDTIPAGKGFAMYSPLHLAWLAFFVLFAVGCSLYYRRQDAGKRTRVRHVFACLLVGDELFKVVMLCIGGNYEAAYLPLHLCSINIILIAIHSFRPGKMLDNFLYTVCVPAATAALLFPTWTELPFCNFMHLHSFTVHILLATYPIMLTAGGDIQPEVRCLPRCLLFLLLLAIPIYGINRLLDTNFMFLMNVDPGNPLYFFETQFGNHLIGIPVLIAAAAVIMFLPRAVYLRLRRKSVSCVSGKNGS